MTNWSRTFHHTTPADSEGNEEKRGLVQSPSKMSRFDESGHHSTWAALEHLHESLRAWLIDDGRVSEVLWGHKQSAVSL